ncbi:unnamed protein product [Schistosoma margrebowiei]|uniref:Uncharacterized protein n=1 Tax=Schistosoma margrebowiei TaxID=48269 RepID=A0A183LF16_9TREM|nr:unnamed protein product [Schistosoma margrebowiei]
MVAGDQRLVHMPFVPSGYWSPCVPLVLNQGFPTTLGGFSVSTNPIKAPDTRFSFSQFRKQHPSHEKAMSRTSLAEAIYA